MNRVLVYLLLAGAAVVVQTVFMPLFLPGYYKPDFILILVVYMGLHEGPWRGGMLVYLMGWCFDGVSGAFPGLNGFVLLAIFLAIRAIVARVNAESSALILLLVMAATILQSALVAFAIDFFKAGVLIWPYIAWQLPIQLLLNFTTAFILLRITVWLQRTFLPRKNLPGLRKLDSRYES